MINDAGGTKKYNEILVSQSGKKEKKGVGGKMDIRPKWARLVGTLLLSGAVMFPKKYTCLKFHM